MEGEAGCGVAVNTCKDAAEVMKEFFFQAGGSNRVEETPAGGRRRLPRPSPWAPRCVNLLWQ